MTVAKQKARGSNSSEETSLAFQGSNPLHRVEMLDELDYTTFEIDPQIQRDEEPAEISRMVKRFNPLALGTFTISVREVSLPSGARVTKWFLVDGQQRRAALLRLKWNGTVRAIVHFNLTVAEEAQLFLDLNDRNTIGPWGRYKARLVADEPQAVAIQTMLDDLGIPLGGSTGFSAITRADRIYSKGANGPANLRWALQLLKDTYNDFDGRVVEALALIHDDYAAAIDTENLRAKLQVNVPTIDKLIGNGNTVRQLYRCTIAVAIAEAIVAVYNKYTRSGAKHSSRLPSVLDRRRKPLWIDQQDLDAMNAADREDEALLLGTDENE